MFSCSFFFFFNDTATTEIYTLSLHDALPISSGARAVVTSGYLSEQEFRGVVDTALGGGCQVLSVPRSVQIAGVHPTTVWRRGQALVELTAPSLKGWQLSVKRVVDIVGAALGLMIAAPLILLIAVAIKLDSPGDVLFSQERVGFGGGP